MLPIHTSQDNIDQCSTRYGSLPRPAAGTYQVSAQHTRFFTSTSKKMDFTILRMRRRRKFRLPAHLLLSRLDLIFFLPHSPIASLAHPALMMLPLTPSRSGTSAPTSTPPIAPLPIARGDLLLIPPHAVMSFGEVFLLQGALAMAPPPRLGPTASAAAIPKADLPPSPPSCWTASPKSLHF